MRKTLAFLLVIIVVGAFLLCWFGRTKPVPQVASPETSAAQSNQEVQEQRQRAPSPPQSAGQLAAQPLPQPSSATAPNPPGNPSSVKDWLEQQYQTPISFYGKVVDQDEAPIAGASIAFDWANAQGEGLHASATSDGQGLFSPTGIRGKGLNVHVSKEGYYTPKQTNQVTFVYADYSGGGIFAPDQANPVVFHLRKKGPGTELMTSEYGVRSNLGVRAPRDGTPVRVDFLSRKVGDAGPLEISQVKPDYEHWQQATEWTFRMAIPDGGFVEHAEEFPFQAPETGYQPAIEFHFKNGETNWTTTFQKQYYIAFGQPRHYGRLVVETAIEMEGARLTYVINPDGSRYLEPK
jgi:hypothetical protein